MASNVAAISNVVSSSFSVSKPAIANVRQGVNAKLASLGSVTQDLAGKSLAARVSAKQQNSRRRRARAARASLENVNAVAVETPAFTAWGDTDGLNPTKKRTDLKKIMIFGAGPIVIGQACEFDYSGTQASVPV